MRWLTLLFICFGFLGPSEIMAQQPVERHLQIQGVDRQYFVFDAHQQKQAPLVLVLHGGGGNGLRMLKRWQSVAQREGLIIVAPNAEKNTWNAVGCCGQGQQQQNADVAFIQQVLKSIQQNYSIDPYHIYIVGFSNGGMLTYQLIAQNRTPFAAAAVVSAAMWAATTSGCYAFIGDSWHARSSGTDRWWHESDEIYCSHASPAVFAFKSNSEYLEKNKSLPKQKLDIKL